MFVNYKATIAGVPVVFVPPAYTSQTCSRCGHIHPMKRKSYRNGKVFKCGHCGFEHDADINAALNIAALGATLVSSPESLGMSCHDKVRRFPPHNVPCQLEGQLSFFPMIQICG